MRRIVWNCEVISLDNQYIDVDVRIFRSGWMPVAAVFTVLAAILGLPGVILLFSPEYAAYQAEELLNSGIASADARMTWQVINTATTVLGLVCPSILAVAVVLSLRGRVDQGMSFLCVSAQGMVYVLNGAGVVLLAILIFRALRYIVSCLAVDTGIYLIYSMLVSEGILVAAVWFLFVRLRRFVSCVGDSAANMAVTLSSGKVDTVPISALTTTGFLVLGIVCLLIGVDRLVTLTVVQDTDQAYYTLLSVRNPVQILEGLSFLCSGCADLLISRYVRRYKHICERVIYERRREILFGDNKSAGSITRDHHTDTVL